MEARDVASGFLAAIGRGDGDAAAALAADAVVLTLPGGKRLEGHDGVRAFAAQHGAVGDREITVEQTGLEEAGPGRFLAAGVMRNVERTTGEAIFELEIGSIVDVADGRVSAFAAFPSPDEARAAL